MYATLYHAFLDLLGVEIPFLKIFMMFGFFVALAFVAASYVMTLDMKRYEAEGVIKPFQVAVKEPDARWEYITSAVIGFLFGFKVLHLFLNLGTLADDPQSYLMSTQGSLPLGIILMLAFVGYKYYQLKNTSPVEKGLTETFYPHTMMGNMTLVAALAGFAGAKLFHHLEHFGDLIDDPMVLFRDPFSGLTFFGGLIAGGAAVIWYSSKRGVNWKTMLDIGGPGMMLAYGVGRMGCHMSGDGDWGVENLAPKPDWLSWAPDWVWAYNYEGNVHGMVLENPVWPTPFYEVIMALAIFGILWGIRKKFAPGVLFSIYLIFAGLERFIIEKIRVNPDYHFLGMNFTQAEMISFTMMLLGVIGIIYFNKINKNKTSTDGTATESVSEA
ncbi:MAG: prolipoprotein diacylglyceryl transferase [Bacteroidia bacterium]